MFPEVNTHIEVRRSIGDERGLFSVSPENKCTAAIGVVMGGLEKGQQMGL